MRVQARGPDGQTHFINALIDTGAEVNLVRRGMLPSTYLLPAPKPLSLVTASGAKMEGGEREATLGLVLRREGGLGQGEGALWTAPASFYEADIHVEAIIGFPWLEENQLGVFPHLRALALRGEQVVLLRGHDAEGEQVQPAAHKKAQKRVRYLKMVEKVRALRLALPEAALGEDTEEPEWEENPLHEDEATQETVAKELLRAAREDEARAAQGVILVPEGEEVTSQRAEELRAALRRDFEGEVLRDRIWGERIVRGPLGEGKIELKPGSVAKKQRPIHLTGERHRALCDLVDEWVRDKKVEEGVPSAWSSPTFVVAKKQGKWRGVVDFRALNEATVTDAYPLPRIEDILVNQGRRYLFSVLDLKDAFHQVPLHEDSRPYTCCSTPRGSKQWCVVVMGLKNGVAIFQRVIDYSLREVADVANPYVDDIIVGTEWCGTEEATLEAHDQDIRRVLGALQEHRLVVDKNKCRFFVREVEFCGHILGGGKRRPAPGKLMALEKWEEPRTITALRGFLGFTNYYSSYVKEYARYAAPLMELLKVGRGEGKNGTKNL
jgi:hypothetical protein